MGKTIDLSSVPFFSDISPERVAQLEGFSMIQQYDEGEVVFENSETARNLYALMDGEVELSILFKDKIVTKDIKYEEYIRTHVESLEKPVVIDRIQEKDVFGWSALVPPGKMTATARCATGCSIVLIPSGELMNAFNKDPELGYLLTSRISSIIVQRLNSRTQKLVDAWCALFEAERISAV